MSDEGRGPPATPMRQWPDEGDARNKGFCIHCGGLEETRDHNPSKIFLDDPLPANLPLAAACRVCNAGFSDDEEYVACLLECVLAGHVDPARLARPSVARTLAGNHRLQREIAQARREDEDRVTWSPDLARVRRIVKKMARGLVAFELNEPQLDDPDDVLVLPLQLMGHVERRTFEGEPGGMAVWPEVGSRAFHRVILGPAESFHNGWIGVQRERFRYRVTQEDGTRVRMVLREYLAAEAVWA